ncbi:hypothetical protein CS022_13075 [Veronia nyctiphanis]|uniref:Uncharacterized protein n=1 Tax=Veronia nyctiphanis TaxID=1278244 RepID=A0A4Q0YQB3_9GAMM|nr:hypothetical protein [Veronia nyctiphanis]RXJ72793.1 hypothetical protein CS022_13075 [Veronia nyctiphanis]
MVLMGVCILTLPMGTAVGDELEIDQEALQAMKKELAPVVREFILATVDGMSLLTNSDLLSAAYVKVDDVRYSGFKLPFNWQWQFQENSDYLETSVFFARGEAHTEEKTFEEDAQTELVTYVSQSVGASLSYYHQLTSDVTIIPSFGVRYQKMKNTAELRGDFAKLLAEPLVNGFIFNWSLDTLTLAPRITLSKKTEFGNGYSATFSSTYQYEHLYTRNVTNDAHRIDFDRNFITASASVETAHTYPLISRSGSTDLTYSVVNILNSNFTEDENIFIHHLQVGFNIKTDFDLDSGVLDEVRLTIGAGSGKGIKSFDVGLSVPF